MSHRLNLGVRQDCAEPIADVELPPWAKTPEAFVRINRDALESEFVSAHIHKWIDMVFGFKQRGPEAEACYNVFSHVTYYGALDMEALYRGSRADWQQANDMLENFGQTPLQLFANPHHQRRALQLLPPVPLLSFRDWFSPAGARFLGAGSSRVLPATRLLALYKTNVNLGAGVMAMGVNATTGSIVTLSKARALAVNPVKQQNGRSTPFDIGADPLLRSRGCPVVAEPFSPLLDVERPSLQAAQLVAVAHNGLFACVVGQWDHALRIVSTHTGATLATLATGQDDLSCVAISRDDKTVVTGSFDNSVVLFTLEHPESTPRVVAKRTLHGHDGAVTCVAINKEMNLVCSGSCDGTSETKELV